ncbi:MAG: hypothetical protein U1C96_07795 [Gallionella sp.]|nr:hypothetical protein [Gallionella sp.]
MSLHAQARIVERNVPADWLQLVLACPQQKRVGDFGRDIHQSVFLREGKPWLLRAIIEDGLVLTVMLTSKVSKYGGAS